MCGNNPLQYFRDVWLVYHQSARLFSIKRSSSAERKLLSLCPPRTLHVIYASMEHIYCLLSRSNSFFENRKSYTTENAYRSHLASKKHKEAEIKHTSNLIEQTLGPALVPSNLNGTLEATKDVKQSVPGPAEEAAQSNPSPADENEEMEESIDAKIAAARTRLTTSDCLFCTTRSESLPANLEHMSISHGFFIPDADYLVDLEGLIRYLGEKIAVGNFCIYCYSRKNGIARTRPGGTADEGEKDTIGREFRSLEATRAHMVDKAHCKIAYDTQKEKLEISDFYDFSSSYPDTGKRRKGKAKAKAKPDEEWEDVEEAEGDDMEVDEVIDEEEEEGEGTDEEPLPDNTLRFGDSPFELVLPSGARIGHRSLKRYYDQSFRNPLQPRGGDGEDSKSGAALVRQLLNEKNSALIPRKGGFGEFGGGMQVVKARNAGEAKEAGRHMKEFRDVKRKEDFKTKVGFIHNHQKHFRDPLLQ
jgi:pre-60S factor REI1